MIAEGQWHHLVLVMSKGMLKNSMATLYIDGQLVNTVKVRLHVNKIIQAFLMAADMQDIVSVNQEINSKPTASDWADL